MASTKNGMEVRRITHQDAKPFIECWHYSKVVPTGHNIFFGWFFGDEMYAVADYGWGVNPYQASFLSRVTGEDVTMKQLVELKRLCRSEPALEKAYLTMFLSCCHKLLSEDGVAFIVSFSDPEHGHNGGIYKAANFQHLGTTGAEMHLIDKDGVKRHRRYAYRYARRNGIHVREAREALGVTPIKTQPKDRWFLKI
jgi:hypothetical protein